MSVKETELNEIVNRFGKMFPLTGQAHATRYFIVGNLIYELTKLCNGDYQMASHPAEVLN